MRSNKFQDPILQDLKDLEPELQVTNRLKRTLINIDLNVKARLQELAKENHTSVSYLLSSMALKYLKGKNYI